MPIGTGMKQIYPVTVLVMLSITVCLALIGGHPSVGRDKPAANAATPQAVQDGGQAAAIASR